VETTYLNRQQKVVQFHPISENGNCPHIFWVKSMITGVGEISTYDSGVFTAYLRASVSGLKLRGFFC